VRTAGKKRFREELTRQHHNVGRRAKEPELSLHTILARYIDLVYNTSVPQHEIEVNPLPEATMLKAFPEESRSFLAAKGYNHEDVRLWASIIMTKNVQLGAEKFLEHVAVGVEGEEEIQKPLPNFLFLTFLQRKDVGPTALRCLIVYAWHQLKRKHRIRPLKSGSPGLAQEASLVSLRYPGLNDSTMFLMIVRLIRHARHTWPAALISIAGMVVANIGHSRIASQTATAKRREYINLQRIEFLYNQTLVLLSHPSPMMPYHAVCFQEIAQFDILQRMASHRPPIAVTLNGYRAIATVQLRNKKTPREKDWAQLKAKSWPPWKHDKTGLDAEKGPEYGVSRALQAIRRMHEAGYKGGLWEKIAQILAGWDIDRSPTIQTRAILPHESSSKRGLAMDSNEPRETSNFDRDHVMIWAARIRTTRTVQEAWACFLAWKDRDLPPHQDVYLPMFEKIHHEAQRQGAELRSRSTAMSHTEAGDSREVFPVPVSPKEATYVRINPPELDELATEMFSKGVMPQGRCLIFLLQNATTSSNGIKYLDWAARVDQSLLPLLSFELDQSQEYNGVPDSVLTAFVMLLSRISPSHFHKILVKKRIMIQGEDSAAFYEDSLTYCYQLLKIRKLRYRPAWHVLLQALSKSNLKLDINQFEDDPGIQQINRYQMLRVVLAEMRGTGLEVDAETLRIVCVGLGQTILACLEVVERNNAATSQALTPSSTTIHLASIGNEPKSLSTESNAKSLLYPTTSLSNTNTLPVPTPETLQAATKVLTEVRPLICKLFYKLTGTKNTGAPDFNSLGGTSRDQFKTLLHPTLLAEPNPQVLHGLIRVLGLLRSWHALAELVQWMIVFRKEVLAATKMPRNGERALRKVIIAIRVFCERSWLLQDEDKVRLKSAGVDEGGKVETAAPKKTINNVRRLVESVEEWGGWPSDDEVREYCSRGQFPTY